MKKVKINSGNRQFADVNLSSYCGFAKETDSLQITEWSNGEGYDFDFIRERGNERFVLTTGEVDAIFDIISHFNGELIKE